MDIREPEVWKIKKSMSLAPPPPVHLTEVSCESYKKRRHFLPLCSLEMCMFITTGWRCVYRKFMICSTNGMQECWNLHNTLPSNIRDDSYADSELFWLPGFLVKHCAGCRKSYHDTGHMSFSVCWDYWSVSLFCFFLLFLYCSDLQYLQYLFYSRPTG